ncbi:MAG: hypothetical protein Kow00109_14380 [Acidobacteriota bacterium]
MKRLVILTALGGLAATAALFGQPEPKRNVLLITIDTLRADHLGCYGATAVATPHLDRLAQEGFRFEWVVSPVPLTLPSHASLLTSAYPTFHGVRDNSGFVLGQDQWTLAEILHEQGYRTGAFVGAFVLDARFGLDQGFEVYRSDFPLSGRETIAPGLIQKRADEVAAAALEWLGRRGQFDRPFFCWIHFYDPHAPYEPPEPYRARYRSDLYSGEVAYVDEVVGDLFRELRERGWWDGTTVIVTSDHGESLGEHGEETHGYFVYEASQRVPLIWKTADRQMQPKTVSGLVRLIDVAPTLLQELGVRVPAVFQGRGLWKYVRQGRVPRQDAYAETYYPRLQFGWSELRAFYQPPYKYIEAPEPELYDLSKDPGEKHNLYTTQQALAGSLRAALFETIQRFSASSTPQAGEMDPETAAALASLGYVTVSAGLGSLDRSYLELPDPKEKLPVYQATTETYTLMRTGRFEEALRVFSQILEKDPQATFVYHSMGMAYARLGRHEEAVRTYRRAVESGQENGMLWFNLGTSLLHLQRWDEAEAAFRKALALDPAHFRAKTNLASLLLNRREFAEALRLCEEVLQVHPDYEVALFNAGVAAAGLGRLQVAVGYLERTLAVNPANQVARENLLRLYEATGQGAKAEQLRRSSKP